MHAEALASARRWRLPASLRLSSAGVVYALVVLVVVLSVASEAQGRAAYLEPTNVSNILDQTALIGMFRSLGFEPEALLRDQLCDGSGELQDVVVLAHAVEETWSGMLSAGTDMELG